MPPVNGTSVLLQVRTATGPDVYTTLGSQRDMEIEYAADEIDTSSKDSADYTGLPGRRSSSLTCDALWIPSDAAKAALFTAYETGAMCRIRRSAVGADAARQADCFITSITGSHPDQGASTLSVSLKLSGPWTATS